MQENQMKMLKQWICLCLTGISVWPVLAGNLLKNSDFSDLTGAKLPRYWTFQGKTLPEVTNKGCLTLGGNESFQSQNLRRLITTWIYYGTILSLIPDEIAILPKRIETKSLDINTIHSYKFTEIIE